MPISTISKVAIIGAGQMGCGIAQVVAQHAKVPVYLYDHNEITLKSNIAILDSRLLKHAEKGAFSMTEYKLLTSRIQPVLKLDLISDADIVIEAIREEETEKMNLFRAISPIVSSDAMIASNTSSISITRLASAMQNPGRVVSF